MQTHLNYKGTLDFFADIATKSKYIDTSLEYSNCDVPVELQKLGDSTVMVIEDPKANISQGSGARVNRFAAFYIIKWRSTKAQVVVPARDIKQECEDISIKVLSYIRNQQRLGNLSAFDLSGIDVLPVDFFDINWHGVRVAIPIKTPIDLSFNDDDWNI